MNLHQTVQALEAKNITVAINLGQHSHCPIDSNCPLAIELRRTMADAGVTLPELLEGYREVIVSEPVNIVLPEFDGRATIRVAGEDLHLDFSRIIGDQLKGVVDRKLRELEALESNFKELGRNLFRSYLYEIEKTRNESVLPQLTFSGEELIQTHCLTSGVDGNYVFIFPEEYKPEYIVKDGIRYKLSDAHIKVLIREVYLRFIISKENEFLSATLLDVRSGKFQHYHGNGHEDCWGAVTLPQTWDGTIRSLYGLATNLTKALATINHNSLMQSEPPNIPFHISTLLEKSTELGREGELEVPEVEGTAPTWGRTAWGRRGGQARQAAPTPDGANIEMMRRFNTTEEPPLEIVCALCGETYGQHYGTAPNVICPRDN